MATRRTEKMIMTKRWTTRVQVMAEKQPGPHVEDRDFNWACCTGVTAQARSVSFSRFASYLVRLMFSVSLTSQLEDETIVRTQNGRSALNEWLAIIDGIDLMKT